MQRSPRHHDTKLASGIIYLQRRATALSWPTLLQPDLHLHTHMWQCCCAECPRSPDKSTCGNVVARSACGLHKSVARCLSLDGAAEEVCERTNPCRMSRRLLRTRRPTDATPRIKTRHAGRRRQHCSRRRQVCVAAGAAHGRCQMPVATTWPWRRGRLNSCRHTQQHQSSFCPGFLRCLGSVLAFALGAGAVVRFT